MKSIKKHTKKHTKKQITHNKHIKHDYKLVNKVKTLLNTKIITKIIPKIIPNSIKYDPLFVIIEPTDISKRVLNFTLLRTILKRYGLQECNPNQCFSKKPMFVWLNHNEHSTVKIRQKYYNTPIYLQNRLINIDEITSKEKLHLGMKAKYPEIYEKHLAHSFLLSKSWKPESNQIYIARPINVLKDKKEKGENPAGFGGKDIVVIYDNKTLEDAKKNLEKYDNVLISEYITNPLLFKKKKFHIRTYLLASIINNEFNAYMSDFGGILCTAKEEYKNSDFSNPDIHDTHMKSTNDDYFFPKDFNNENMGRDDITFDTITNIFEQIINCFKAVAQLLSENVSNYDNVKNGFYIFGVDLMIENANENENENNTNPNKYNVILLEVNEKGGYGTITKKAQIKLANLLINWINDNVLKSIFDSKKNNKFCLFSKTLTH